VQFPHYISHLIAALNGSKVVQMVNNRSSNKILVSTARILSIVTDLVRGEILIIKDFISKMPSIIESTQESISKAHIIRTALSKSVPLARRDMNNHILIMGNSPVFRNSVHGSSSKVDITDSRRAKSVKVKLVLANKTIARKIKSSDSSESTTQAVTSDVETESRVRFNQFSDLGQEAVSKLVVVAVIEIFKSLGFNVTAKAEVDTSRKTNLFNELSGGIGASESENDSSFIFVDKGREG